MIKNEHFKMESTCKYRINSLIMDRYGPDDLRISGECSIMYIWMRNFLICYSDNKEKYRAIWKE